uniref:Uncharacterized protein n=1 Tax=Strix occidentalis caurina TaxID=311401 RepID=A0A8D0F880_STROC
MVPSGGGGRGCRRRPRPAAGLTLVLGLHTRFPTVLHAQTLGFGAGARCCPWVRALLCCSGRLEEKHTGSTQGAFWFIFFSCRRKLAERTEASTQVSEFNVSCKGAGEKLVLSELLQPIRPKSALSTVKKELTKVKQKKAVELPLSKEEAERVSGPSRQQRKVLALWGSNVEPLSAPLLL